MISLDPDQRPAAGEGQQAGAVIVGQAILGRRIVEGIAQQNDSPRGQPVDLAFQAIEGFAGVVGRQHLPSPGIGRALLEVQIGDHQGLIGDQPQRAARPTYDLHVGQTKADAAIRARD